jgi:hypothetical protein
MHFISFFQSCSADWKADSRGKDFERVVLETLLLVGVRCG